MPRVAERAMVSEATAYRYFPDLTSLIQETLAGLWPDPAAALAPVEHVARPGGAGGLRLRAPAARRARVPGLGARDDPHTITAPATAGARPGLRFGLIDYALAPFEASLRRPPPTR